MLWKGEARRGTEQTGIQGFLYTTHSDEVVRVQSGRAGAVVTLGLRTVVVVVDVVVDVVVAVVVFVVVVLFNK